MPSSVIRRFRYDAVGQRLTVTGKGAGQAPHDSVSPAVRAMLLADDEAGIVTSIGVASFLSTGST